MIKKIAAFYSVFIGISVLGMWFMILLNNGISEGPIEISFHILSEFLMAILLFLGGIGLLKEKIYGKLVFLISHGMLLYSVLNATGYYGQRSDFMMMGIFIILFTISSTFVILALVRKEDFI